MRRRLPTPLVRLGVARKPRKDCGAHEWYRSTEHEDRCYHCQPGLRRPSGFVTPDEPLAALAAPSILGLTSALLDVGILLPEALPGIATQMLVDGLDTPALREMAGLDLAPYDPRDARDIFVRVLEEADQPLVTGAQAVTVATAFLAAMVMAGRMPEQDATHCFYLLAIATEYSATPPALMHMYSLDDDWDMGGPEVIEREVRDTARQLLDRLDLLGWTPPEAVVTSVLRQRLR